MGSKSKQNGRSNGGSVHRLPATGGRTLATSEDVLAAMLHEAKAQNIRDGQIIAELRFQVAKMEAVLREQQQAAFREEHGLVIGRRLEQDKATGEFFWIEEAPAAPGAPVAAEDVPVPVEAPVPGG